MSAKSPDGKIITFYSYKGGTGRSMAVANMAWILASNRKRVLVIDWDLEAPGLHRYFRPFLVDRNLEATDGLIDFVTQFALEVMSPVQGDEPLAEDWYWKRADILQYAVSLDWQFPEGGAIDFVPAGRQGPSYSIRFGSFDWQNFYERLGGGVFLEAAKKRMRAEYDYILIDSRTGVSDTAGICTVQMPDVLVVCFTLNNQSSGGAANIAKSVAAQRGSEVESGDFRIFPVPMRVDPFEKTKLDRRRKYAQRLFSSLLGNSFSFDQATYWPAVEVPYIPHLAYEEVLTPFVENPNDPKSALAAIGRLTSYITDGKITQFYFPVSPVEQQNVLLAFSELPEDASGADHAGDAVMLDTEDSILTAEAAYARLSKGEQTLARNVWSRLVSAGRTSRDLVYEATRAPVDAFSEAEQSIVQGLVKVGLLKLGRDELTRNTYVEVLNPEFPRHWTRLQTWITADLDFLLWRQQLQDVITVWKASNQHVDFLLRGDALVKARKWYKQCEDRLSKSERFYVSESQLIDGKAERRFYGIVGFVTLLFLLTLVTSVVFTWRQNNENSVQLKSKTDAITHNYEGLHALDQGDVQQARIAFEAAAKSDPKNGDALKNLGNVYLTLAKTDSSNYEAAISSFSRAQGVESNSVDLYLKISGAYDAMGDYDLALKELAELEVRASYTNGLAQNLALLRHQVDYVHGVISQHKKDYGESLKYLSAALKAKPDYGEALLARAKTQVLMGDKDAARKDLELIKTLPNQDPKLLTQASLDEAALKTPSEP